MPKPQFLDVEKPTKEQLKKLHGAEERIVNKGNTGTNGPGSPTNSSDSDTDPLVSQRRPPRA